MYLLQYLWRKTLAVGKFGEFTAKSYWRNKIWQICYVARANLVSRGSIISASKKAPFEL